VRRAAAVAAALLVLAAGEARPDAPPCLVEVSLSATRAFVGEQIEHRLRVLRRTDVSFTSWLEAPEFRGFRVEMMAGGFEPERQTIDGRSYVVYQERRALFGLEPGRLAISPARIECRLSSLGAFARESVPADVPGAELEVAPLPAAGRPEGFSGLVGPVTATLDVVPHEIALGRSIHVVATLVGEGNLWDAAPPFDAKAGIADAEVFAETPTLELAPGARLRLRRTFVYDVVPRQAGVLELGPWTVPYFDASTGAFAVAQSGAVAVTVREAPPPASAAAAPREDASAQAAAPERASRLLPPLGLAALAALGAVAGVLLRARRRAAHDPLREALAAADAAAQRGDRAAEARALGVALRLGIERRLAARTGASAEAALARATTAEELEARATGDLSAAEAARLLTAFERARFAPGAAPPDVSALRDALARLVDR
jgi:hypothetical protein